MQSPIPERAQKKGEDSSRKRPMLNSERREMDKKVSSRRRRMYRGGRGLLTFSLTCR